MELQLVYFWAGQRVLRHRRGARSDAGGCPAFLSAALRGLFPSQNMEKQPWGGESPAVGLRDVFAHLVWREEEEESVLGHS